MLKDKDIIVISDEIYAELTYNGRACLHCKLSGDQGQDHCNKRFFKSLCYDGLEARLCMRPPGTDRVHMKKIHQYAIMCSPTTAQYAALEALKESDDDVACDGQGV